MRTPPDRWSLLLQMTRRHQKGLICGLFTAFIITTSSCISIGIKPETLGSHAPQTSSQQAMAAVPVPPMPIVKFPELLMASLYQPLAIQAQCYCFGYESSFRFSSTSMINVDFTSQNANVREIDLRNNDIHSLRGSMAFQISNRTHSFLDENATMMLRLD